MPTRLTLKFLANQGNRPVGWSESIVFNSEDLNLAATALYGAGGYVMKRLFCLGSGVINTAGKLTKIPVAGPVPIDPPRRITRQIAGFPFNVGVNSLPYYGDAAKVQVADFGQSVFMMRLQSDIASTPVYTATYWLAALPDIAQAINQSRPSAGYWLENMEGLKAVLKSGPFLLQTLDKSDGNPLKLCTAYSADQAAFTVAGHGWNTGEKIVATGFRGNQGAILPKGTYRIEKIDADKFRLAGARTMAGILTLGGFRRLKLAYPAIKDIAERGWTNKKKGRPSELLAGRRSAPRTSRG